MFGEKAACAAVYPSLVHSHTYRGRVTRHSGSCTLPSEVSVTEFFMS